jgi:hypothetical protein
VGILDDAIREHLELKRRRGATDDELAKQEAEALGPARRQPVADPAAEAGLEPLDEEVLPPPALSTAAEDAPPPPSPESIEPLEPLEVDPGDRLPPHGDVEPLDEEPAALEEPLHAEPAAADPLAPPPEPIEDDPLALPPEPAPEPDFPPTEVMAADEPASAAEPAEPDLSEPPPATDDDATRVSIDDATRVRPTRPLPPLDDESLPPEPAVPEPEPARPDPEPEPSAGTDEDVLEETPDFLQDTPDHDRLWFEQKPPRDFDFDD